MFFSKDFIQSALPYVDCAAWVCDEMLGAAIDSRLVQPKELFIALRGARHNGHDYIVEAIERGASGLLIEKKQEACLKALSPALQASLNICIVDDTMQALFDLAAAWRAQFAIPVIGITGSVGKTTTKELTTKMVRNAGIECLATVGNLNTLIGSACTIFNLREQHKVAIFEVGINKRGEMAKIAKLVRPTMALITGIGHTHMEGLGSIHDIAYEKRQIFSLFKESNIGIINGDQPVLSLVSYPHPIIKFGIKTTNQIQARKVKVEGSTTTMSLKLYKEKYTITLPTIHSGAVYNALGAITLGYLLQIPVASLIASVQESCVVPGRFEPRALKSHKGTIINDCYNANPESMKAALLAFEKLAATAPKVAILGDMLELGSNAPFWHRQLGRFMRKVPSLKRVILVGSMVEWTRKTAPVNVAVDLVPTWQAAQELLEKELEQDALVLVKGSRGMGLTNLVDAMT